MSRPVKGRHQARKRAVDLLFEPSSPVPEAENEAAPRVRDVQVNDPEPLVGGVVDLGALATEFLILGLNPYPRKSGAIFEALPEGKPDNGPFAALAPLAKRGDGC